MQTTIRSLTNRGTRRKLRASIELWRNNLIDLETSVNDKRQAVDRTLHEFFAAVRERDRAAAHLAQLIDWHDAKVQPEAPAA